LGTQDASPVPSRHKPAVNYQLSESEVSGDNESGDEEYESGDEDDNENGDDDDDVSSDREDENPLFMLDGTELPELLRLMQVKGGCTCPVIRQKLRRLVGAKGAESFGHGLRLFEVFLAITHLPFRCMICAFLTENC
jgi:hypothetical protein